MSDRRAAFDDEGLPWLEAVPDEDAPRAVSGPKMLAAVSLVLLAAVLIASTFFLVGRRNAGPTSGPAEIIRADPRPYKVKPADPGGLDAVGESPTVYQTGAGQDTDAQIDLNAVSEAPIARPQPKVVTPPPLPAEAKGAKPAPAEREPVTAAAGSVVQLGAFSSGAKAEAAWKALSGRFQPLAAATKIIVPVSNGKGGTLYRLRAGAASSADAKSLCQTMRVAGESCVVIG